jgi:hypothetical protein
VVPKVRLTIWRLRRGYTPLGGIAIAIAIAGTAIYASTHTGGSGTAIHTSTQIGGSAPEGTANLWVDAGRGAAGASCTRNSSAVTYSTAVSSGNVCDTFNRAYAVAADGDQIPVLAGDYPSQSRYFDSTVVHATPVTFTCVAHASEASVTFDAARFIIFKANGLGISGRCFRFQLIDFGESRGNALNITLDNIHMESFDLAGAKNVTIKNSQIGPSVACTIGTGTSSDCGQRGAVWPETWYASKRIPADNEGNGQAQIRGGTYDPPTGINLLNNYFHDFHTRSSQHAGCLQSQRGGTLNWTIVGNAFERCTSQDVLFDSNADDVTYSGLTIENNFFGYTSSFDSNSQQTEGSGYGWKFKTQGTTPLTMSDVTVGYNAFTKGFAINSTAYAQLSYSNVKVIGNVMGENTSCDSAAGLTWDYNVYADAGCGDTHGVTSQTYDASNPYATWDEGPVQVEQWTPVAGPTPGSASYPWKSWVPSAVLNATDYNGASRSYPTNAGAVGP